MNLPTQSFYRLDSKNKVRVWTIEVEEFDIIMQHGALDEHNNLGKLQSKIEVINEGKAGRSREEQVLSRVKSRISKQLDKGYVDNIKDAKPARNGAGFPKPMLATPLKDATEVSIQTVYYQMKYDGIRCLVTKRDGELYAYSRNGKPINSVPHIIMELFRLNEGDTVDGELYSHGASLQSINSLVRGSTKDTTEIKYRVYDMVNAHPYPMRLQQIKVLCHGLTHVIPAETKILTDDLETVTTDAIAAGYEGIILRTLDTRYEAGKRSKSLIKVKRFHDAEFTVFNCVPSPDGFGILSLFSATQKPFTVLAPGTAAEKSEVANNPKAYIGRQLTVKYANLTPDGIPFHPVAVAWRDPAD